MKLQDIEALQSILKNASVTVNDVPVPSIYELAGLFKAEIAIRNDWHYTTIKKDLVAITLTNQPF